MYTRRPSGIAPALAVTGKYIDSPKLGVVPASKLYPTIVAQSAVVVPVTAAAKAPPTVVVARRSDVEYIAMVPVEATGALVVSV